MSNKTYKLSLTEINKLDKKFNEHKSIRLIVSLPEGGTKEYSHSIAVTFKKTDIDKLSIDYLSILAELQDTPDITSETFYNANSLLNALIVKYFSDVPIPLKLDSLQSVIRVSESLFNLGIMEQMFDPDKGFSKVEIDKLTEQLSKQSKSIGEKLGEMAIAASLNQTGDETNGYNELETT